MKKMSFILGGCCIFFAVVAAAKPPHPGVMLGAYIPTTVEYTNTILSFDEKTNFTHTHTLLFAEFNYDFEQWPYLLEQIRDAGKIPIITWQPGIMGKAHPSFSNSSFLRGDHDAGIFRMANQLKNFGDTVYLRFAHEMNIRSAPAWPGHPWNNQSAQEFIDMYRYVHDKFDEVGADNVIWVWSVAYLGDAIGLDTFSNWKNLYPGDAYVDMTGLSGLNYGNNPSAGPGYSVTVQWLYMPILRDMMAGGYAGAGEGAAATMRELAKVSGGKPQGIFEFGTVGDYDSGAFSRSPVAYSTIPKEDWIKQSYDCIRNMEEFLYVRLVLWYNGIADSGGYYNDFRVARNPGRDEGAVPQSWTQAYKDAIHGVYSSSGDSFFLEEPLTLEEMTPSGFYRAPSLVTENSYPQHEFWLTVYPGGELRRGSTLGSTYFLYPSAGAGLDNPDICDVYVAAQIPGGSFYAFLPPSRWVPFNLRSEIPPATVKNFGLKRESRGTAFTMSLGSNLPLGTYTVYSILVPPGADPRDGGDDLKITGFVLTE
jgi:hypothetical protein